MKESPRRYTNPFLSDKENDKVNFTTNLEDEKLTKSLEPSILPAESLQKAKDLYIDKNVTECQLPEVIACYEENGYHGVKDICVDEGLSHGEKIECGKEHQELSCSPVTVNEDKDDDMRDNVNGTQLISSPLEDYSSSGTKDENCGPENSMQNGEETVDSTSINSVNNSIKISEPFKNGVNDVDQQISEGKTNQTVDISNEIKMEENTISNSDNVKPATVSVPLEPPLEAETAPNHHDIGSNSITVAPRGGGEASFSMAGSALGLITYSGPITYSGSISHRSDESNSSVRSFAFPILQNEWNSSPVRMTKVDQPKHRGWRQTLMCCRF